MRLFPFTRPRTSLYFSTDTFCAGQVQRGLDGPKLSRYVEQALPAGSIRLSPIAQNVASPEHVLPIMQANLDAKTRPYSIALCLPDLCTRMVIVELASVPKSKKEQKALVEWRLQKELNLSPNPRRLSYQLFGTAQSRFSTKRSPSGSVRLLALTIQSDIIERYEKLCVDAGGIPASINVAGLAVVNLCRPVMEATLQTHAQDVSFVPDTVIFVYVGDWGFSLLVFQNGQPHFVRVKPIRQRSTIHFQPSQSVIEEDSSSMSAHAESHAEETAIPQEPDILRLDQEQDPTLILAQEILGSLQFFFETTPDAGSQTHVYPIFLAGSPQPEVVLPKIAETIERAFPLKRETNVPQVQPFSLFPQNPKVQAKTLSGLTHWTSTTLALSASGYRPS